MKVKLTIIFLLVFLSFTGCSKSNQWGFNKNDIESILVYDIHNPNSDNVPIELTDAQSNEIIDKILELKILNYSDFDPPTPTHSIEIKIKNSTEKYTIVFCEGEDYFTYDDNGKMYLLKSSSFIDCVTNIANK